MSKTKQVPEQIEETQRERNLRLRDEAEAEWVTAVQAEGGAREEVTRLTKGIEPLNHQIRSAALAGQPIGPIQEQIRQRQIERQEVADKLRALQAVTAEKRRLVEQRGLMLQQQTKDEAWARLPQVIEAWAEVVRANKYILDELRDLTKLTLAPVRFGYGLVPDLDNPVIGQTRIDL